MDVEKFLRLIPQSTSQAQSTNQDNIPEKMTLPLAQNSPSINLNQNSHSDKENQQNGNNNLELKIDTNEGLVGPNKTTASSTTGIDFSNLLQNSNLSQTLQNLMNFTQNNSNSESNNEVINQQNLSQTDFQNKTATAAMGLPIHTSSPVNFVNLSPNMSNLDPNNLSLTPNGSKRSKQDSIIRSGYGPSSIVGNACLVNSNVAQPPNINIYPQNGMIQDIPSIPLEYLKQQFKTYETRDIECGLCHHMFKAGKYKVNNTKLRQHVLAKHKDHLNRWLRENGSSIFSDQHFELFERPWRCQICSKTYKLKHHLKQHMEATHNDYTIIPKRSKQNVVMKNVVNLGAAPNSGQNNNQSQSDINSTLEALMAHFSTDQNNVNNKNSNLKASPKTSDEGHISPESFQKDMPSSSSRHLSSSPCGTMNEPVVVNNSTNNPNSVNSILNFLNKNTAQNNENDGPSMAKRPKLEIVNESQTIEPEKNNSALIMKLMQKMASNQENNTAAQNAISLPSNLKNSQPLSPKNPTLLQQMLSKQSLVKEELEEKSELKSNIISINLPQNSTIKMESSEQQVKKDSTCEYCHIIFPDTIMFTLHMGQHCVNEPFKCNICNHQCKDRYDFMCHFAQGKHV